MTPQADRKGSEGSGAKVIKNTIRVQRWTYHHWLIALLNFFHISHCGFVMKGTKYSSF